MIIRRFLELNFARENWSLNLFLQRVVYSHRSSGPSIVSKSCSEKEQLMNLRSNLVQRVCRTSLEDVRSPDFVYRILIAVIHVEYEDNQELQRSSTPKASINCEVTE